MSFEASVGGNAARSRFAESAKTGLDIEMVDYRQSPRHWLNRRSYVLAAEPELCTDTTEGGKCLLNSEVPSQPLEKDVAYTYMSQHRSHYQMTLQGKVYNFLERPTGWKCFIYHFTV